MYAINSYYYRRYERGEEVLLRNSREDSLEQYKGTPSLSHIDSPRGKEISY